MAIQKKTVVSAEKLRVYFNKYIQPGIDNKLYTVACIKKRDPAPSSSQPPGTKSCSFEVRTNDDDKKLISRCHAFVLPSGAISASGKLDPKEVLTPEGELLYVVK